MKMYKGRVIIPGNVKGEILVSQSGFNILASFKQAIASEDSHAICSDHNNPYLYQKELKDKIICIPQATGSTTAGIIIQTIAALKKCPKAFLFSETAESLAISGVILADIWENTPICTIDGLGENFLQEIKDNQIAEILNNGTVIIQEKDEYNEI